MSSLKFGTSGLRGLVTDLEGEPARLWTAAFLDHLEITGAARQRTLLVGRDLRSSSPGIALDCMMAAQACGWRVLDSGALPTPALALAALHRSAPAVMVTGSHIPDDRNGLKFYAASGEITKADENGIRSAFEALGKQTTDTPVKPAIEDASREVLSAYRNRYLSFFPADALRGLTIGVYQQSTVARDLLVDLLGALGAETLALGRADRFIPVDTEAHRPEDVDLLYKWAAESRLDAIVSADGDADRPLVADATGAILRGDLLALLAAEHLSLATVVTPVTSSAAVETSGVARTVYRTKVGSPYVIEGIERAIAAGADDVIGFEANGGILLGSAVHCDGRTLEALPTRDAVLPILCVLAGARQRTLSVRQSVDRLGAGYALADRLKEIPSERSAHFLQDLARKPEFAAEFFREVGHITQKSDVDGVRFVLNDGSVVHFRASGNAPEFRCYVEASSEARANDLLTWGLAKAKRTLDEVR